jgi:hypothetical protein
VETITLESINVVLVEHAMPTTTPRLMHLHAYASPMPSPVTVARLASE